MTDRTEPESTINGRATRVGHKVRYTDSAGKHHDAKIQRLDGENADLETDADGGGPRQFTGVPHSPDPIGHSWSHYPD